jgi:hypothetical protein
LPVTVLAQRSSSQTTVEQRYARRVWEIGGSSRRPLLVLGGWERPWDTSRNRSRTLDPETTALAMAGR